MSKEEAYRMIDQAGEGSFFYRLALSPDPIGEDTRHDLDMRELTIQTMQVLDTRLHKALVWAGALHADHKPHRHVHILAVSPRRLTVKDFERLRLEATRESLTQRRALDFSQESKTRQRFPTYQTVKYDRTERRASHVARGGSAVHMHACTCPRCGTPHVEYGRNRVHQCTCGFLLHKQKERSLQRKGGGWERSR
jgi:hypothetical protein